MESKFLSFSGIEKDTLFQYIYKSIESRDKLNMKWTRMILTEIKSLHALNILWFELVKISLANYHHNEVITFIYSHCEDFEDYDNDTKLCTIETLLSTLHKSIKCKDCLLTLNEELFAEFKLSKRHESKLWKSHIQSLESNKLYAISQLYSELEYVDIRLTCFAIAVDKKDIEPS